MFDDTSRGASEIIYVFAVTAIVVTVGVGTVTYTTDLADDSSQEINPPEFELTSSDPVVIEYVGEAEIDPSTTSEIEFRFNNSYDRSFTIYPDRFTNLSTTSVVYNSQNYYGEDYFIPYDTEIQVVWNRTNGAQEIVQTMYVPPLKVTGSSVRTDAELNGTVVPEFYVDSSGSDFSIRYNNSKVPDTDSTESIEFNLTDDDVRFEVYPDPHNSLSEDQIIYPDASISESLNNGDVVEVIWNLEDGTQTTVQYLVVSDDENESGNIKATGPNVGIT